MNKGFSIIVCCYNSEERITQTLIHLRNLQMIEGYPVEVIIVDNNSGDQTIEKAIESWGCLKDSIILRIVKEFKQGLTYARIKGINEAKYDYLIFCDDDNWLFPNYLKVVFDNFKNKDCYALGGVGIAESVDGFPDWFFEFNGFGYAIGSQNRVSGKGQFAYGAGMAIRKMKAQIYARQDHLLTDRIGSKMSSGGDTEICHIIGKENIYFDETLKFYHFLPSNRLSWEYYKRLNASFGTAHSYLVYYYLAKESKLNAIWILLSKLFHSLNFLLYHSFKKRSQTNEIEFLFNYFFLKGSIHNFFRFKELYNMAKSNLKSIDS